MTEKSKDTVSPVSDDEENLFEDTTPAVVEVDSPEMSNDDNVEDGDDVVSEEQIEEENDEGQDAVMSWPAVEEVRHKLSDGDQISEEFTGNLWEVLAVDDRTGRISVELLTPECPMTGREEGHVMEWSHQEIVVSLRNSEICVVQYDDDGNVENCQDEEYLI